MNRWDWIRSIIGVPSARSAVTNEEVLLQVREGFQSIATSWQRFEIEVLAKLDMARSEYKSYGKLVGERIQLVNQRLEILEGILLDPDPVNVEKNLAAARKSFSENAVAYKSHKR